MILINERFKELNKHKNYSPTSHIEMFYLDKYVIMRTVKKNIIHLDLLNKNTEEIICSAEAKCHPDDHFNIEEGTNLALARLWEKYYKEINAKYYIKNFITGAMYEVNTGTWFKDSFGCRILVGDLIKIYYPTRFALAIVINRAGDIALDDGTLKNLAKKDPIYQFYSSFENTKNTIKEDILNKTLMFNIIRK